mgnify:FL=1
MLHCSKKDTTYYNYNIPPEYLDGGINGFRKFIAKNLQYTEGNRRKKIEGTVIISFIIGKDGIARDFKVKKSAHPLLDEEALRVLRLTGKWKPGYMDGKTVDLEKSIPIKFGNNGTRYIIGSYSDTNLPIIQPKERKYEQFYKR